MERLAIADKPAHAAGQPGRIIAFLLLACGTCFSYGFLYLQSGQIKSSLGIAGLALLPPACLALFLLLWFRRQAWLAPLDALLTEHTEQMAACPAASVGAWVALAASLGLYAEMMIIRFHSYFVIFSYFKNVSLFSCFLGLGIGYSLGSRRLLATPLVLPLLALQIIPAHLLRHHGSLVFLANPVREQLALGVAQAATAAQAATVYGLLLLVFIFNALTFVPLGQLASFLMLRQPPMTAYGWNLAGSLLGIGLFTLVSFCGAPPSVWILFPAAALMLFLRRQPKALLISALSAAVLLAFFGSSFRPNEVSEIYSPYQSMNLVFSRNGPPVLHVSNIYYQNILDLGPNAAPTELSKTWADYYGLPYQFKPKPRDVLIVGAGSGNDVASALRHGAERVDAVEIDPRILEIGKALHPESPYQDPRVSAHVNDARAFIRHSRSSYDLIVYGLLDSKALLSGLSGIRLDSYVYTVEAFREARARLKPGGIICLTFTLPPSAAPALGRKFFVMLKEAFDGREPGVYRAGYDEGYSFVIGGDFSPSSAVLPPRIREMTKDIAQSTLTVEGSTDDWPFIYMPVKRYPLSYLGMIALLLAASLTLIRQLMGRAEGQLSAPCFFLGAGFMLVEAKAITELALVYGSTWLVIAVVVAVIIILAFLANWLMMTGRPPRRALVYGLLLACLAAGRGLSSGALGALGGLAPWLGRGVLTLAALLPIFFSGLAFSAEIMSTTSLPAALSSNLMGAILGGLLEYNSLYFGFRFLYFLAMLIYGLAFLSTLRVPGRLRAGGNS